MSEILPTEGHPITDEASIFLALKWGLLHMQNNPYSYEEYSTLIQKINETLSPFQLTLKHTGEFGIDAVSVFTALKDRLLRVKRDSQKEYSALLEQVNRDLFPFQITPRDGEE